MLSLWFAFALLAGVDSPQRIEIEVGKTVSLDVGSAIGSSCDNQTVVHAEMKNGPQGTNVFVLTGLHAGTSMCRVGMTEGRPSTLYQVEVVEPTAPETGMAKP